MIETSETKYKQIIDYAYNAFSVNTKESNIKGMTAIITNSVEEFNDNSFIKRLLNYFDKIQCDFTYKINNKKKEVYMTFKLRKNSKYYFN